MPVKHTENDLNHLMRVVNNFLGMVHAGYRVRLDRAYGQRRLVSFPVGKPAEVIRELSPRLPKSQLYHWIDAWYTGLEMGRHL